MFLITYFFIILFATYTNAIKLTNYKELKDVEIYNIKDSEVVNLFNVSNVIRCVGFCEIDSICAFISFKNKQLCRLFSPKSIKFRETTNSVIYIKSNYFMKIEYSHLFNGGLCINGKSRSCKELKLNNPNFQDGERWLYPNYVTRRTHKCKG